MKYLLFLTVVLLTACQPLKFKHFEFEDFKYLLRKDTTFTYYPIDSSIYQNRFYVMKLGVSDEYRFGENFYLPNLTDSNEVIQYSYFYFDKNGRVFFNTVNPARDHDKQVFEPEEIKIDPVLEVCDSSFYSRQGFYRIVKTDDIDQKYVKMENRGKMDSREVIEIEFERKSLFKRRILGHKHYIVRGFLSKKEVGGYQDLEIFDVKVPKKYGNVRLENSVESNLKLLETDSIFHFPLRFNLDYSKITLDTSGCNI